MHAVGLDKSSEHRVAYALPVEIASLMTEMPGVYLYDPLTPQLQSAEKGSHNIMPNLTFYISENHADTFKTTMILPINAVPSAVTSSAQTPKRSYHFCRCKAGVRATSLCRTLLSSDNIANP